MLLIVEYQNACSTDLYDALDHRNGGPRFSLIFLSNATARSRAKISLIPSATSLPSFELKLKRIRDDDRFIDNVRIDWLDKSVS